MSLYETIINLKPKFGNAFYLIDLDVFETNYRYWNASFGFYYPNTKFAYSYKTNYLPIFCRKIKELGGLAEVVSDTECAIAKSIGVEDENIIFNGPVKSTEISANIVMHGGIVNVDSYAEAVDLIRMILEKTSGKFKSGKCKIGIRCNFEVNGRTSRFGIDINSEEFNELIRLIKESNMEIGCLHCHIKGRSLKAWHEKTQKMLDLYESIRGYCANTCYIDLGGGLPAAIGFESLNKTPKEYANVIAGAFARRFKDNGPILLLEPGTAFVATCMCFVTTAVAQKALNGKTYVTLFGSRHNLGSEQNRSTEFVIHYPERNVKQHTILSGYTCLEDDLICEYDKEVKVGDTLIFDNVGAYSIVMKPPFIMPNFPIVGVNIKDQGYEIVRSGESVFDFCSQEELNKE